MPKTGKTGTAPGRAYASLSDNPPATFEVAMVELEAIVARMESSELSLEDSLSAHKRGLELARYCQDTLARAQQQVKVLEDGMLKTLAEVDPDE
jgi:exodeoxyribonuclease VII small subunit